MNTPEKPGRELHSDDEDARRAAASMMGKARTERKTEASRQNAARATEARRGTQWTEEQKAKLRAAQSARREREKAERDALGLATVLVEKKKPGRPKTRPEVPAGEKRPVGRPKKQTGQETVQTAGTAENGA